MSRPALIVLLLAVLVLLPTLGAVSQQTNDRIAYGILEDLALEARNERLIAGGSLIVGGLLVGATVAAVVPPPDGLWIGGLVAGIGVVPGVIVVAIPSEAERAFADASSAPQEDQERRALVALTRLAEKAKERRYMRAIGYAAAGLASLAFPSSLQFITPYDWLYSSLMNLGMAAVTMLIPSREEQALQTYERLAAVGA